MIDVCAAQPSDADPLAALAIRVFRAIYGGAFPDPVRLDQYLAATLSASVFAAAIAGDAPLLRVAWVEGALAGYARLQAS